MLSIEAPGAVRTMMVSFRRGDYIIEELRELLKKEGVDAALITSGIGSFDVCKLHTTTGTRLPPEDRYFTLEGPIEGVHCMGRLPGESHIFMSSYTTQLMTISMLAISSQELAVASVLSWG